VNREALGAGCGEPQIDLHVDRHGHRDHVRRRRRRKRLVLGQESVRYLGPVK
jgi:hypothetical protein